MLTIGSSAKKRFNDYIIAKLYDLMGVWPETLSHYTSRKGMLCIITNDVLRAYCNSYVPADPTEGKYAADIMKKYINRLCIDNKSNEHIKKLFSFIKELLNQPNFSRFYSLSFSAKINDKDMWWSFGEENKGFSFMIPTYITKDWVLESNNEAIGFFGKCIYDENILTKLCLESLNEIREIFISDSEAGFNPNPSVYASMYIDSIHHLALYFKNQGNNQSEWRYVFTNSRREEKIDEHGRYYIDLPLITKTDPYLVKEIFIGQNCDQKSIDQVYFATRSKGCNIVLHSN